MKNQQHEQPQVLFFTPQLPCTVCGRMTHYSELNNSVQGLLPCCWEHGLIEFPAQGERATAYALQEQYASVARFVIGMYSGFGVATVIGPIEPQSIPGYEPPSPSKMERYQYGFEGNEAAWAVRYEVEENVKTVFACWSYDENMFYLYDEEHGLVGPLEESEQ